MPFNYILSRISRNRNKGNLSWIVVAIFQKFGNTENDLLIAFFCVLVVVFVTMLMIVVITPVYYTNNLPDIKSICYNKMLKYLSLLDASFRFQPSFQTIDHQDSCVVQCHTCYHVFDIILRSRSISNCKFSLSMFKFQNRTLNRYST